MLPETATTWNIDEENIFEVQNNFTRDVLGQDNLFTRVNLLDLQLVIDACQFIGYEKDRYVYLNQDANSDYYASLEFSAIIPEDMDLYFYYKGSHSHICTVFLDDQPVYTDVDGVSSMQYENIVHIGEVSQG